MTLESLPAYLQQLKHACIASFLGSSVDWSHNMIEKLGTKEPGSKGRHVMNRPSECTFSISVPVYLWQPRHVTVAIDKYIPIIVCSTTVRQRIPQLSEHVTLFV